MFCALQQSYRLRNYLPHILVPCFRRMSLQDSMPAQATNVDDLHANGKAAAAREAAQRAAEAELRAACTFRPSLAKVRSQLSIRLLGIRLLVDGAPQQQTEHPVSPTAIPQTAKRWPRLPCQSATIELWIWVKDIGCARRAQWLLCDNQARVSGLGMPADVAARLLRPNGAMSAEEQRQDRLRRLKVRLITKIPSVVLRS